VALGILKTTLQHHGMSPEIQRLQLIERCRKRAAEKPAESLQLQRIFDTASQSVGNAAASTVAFGEIESFTNVEGVYCHYFQQMLVLLLRESQEHVTECAMADRFFTDLKPLLMEEQRVYLHQIHSSIFCLHSLPLMQKCNIYYYPLS